MEDKKRRQIEALRRSIKRRKNKAAQGDPLEVEVQCGEDQSIDNSNLIQVGGIADFHEHLASALRFLNLMSRQVVDEDLEPTFYVFRTDTNAILARGIRGFDAAKKRAGELRKQYGLKFDQVKFKSQRKLSGTSSGAPKPSRSRVDTSSRYNPSKRGYFRVRMNPDGSTADID